MPCTALLCYAMLDCAMLVYVDMMGFAMNAGAGLDSPVPYGRSSWAYRM